MAKRNITKKDIIERLENTNTEISVEEHQLIQEKKEEKDRVGGYSQWAKHSGGKFSPTMPTAAKLDPGFYELGQS